MIEPASRFGFERAPDLSDGTCSLFAATIASVPIGNLTFVKVQLDCPFAIPPRVNKPHFCFNWPQAAGRGQAHGSSGDWRIRVEEHTGPSESATPSHWSQHGPVRRVPEGTLRYGWKSLSPDRSP